VGHHPQALAVHTEQLLDLGGGALGRADDAIRLARRRLHAAPQRHPGGARVAVGEAQRCEVVHGHDEPGAAGGRHRRAGRVHDVERAAHRLRCGPAVLGPGAVQVVALDPEGAPLHRQLLHVGRHQRVLGVEEDEVGGMPDVGETTAERERVDRSAGGDPLEERLGVEADLHGGH
jgi:hypothetical protein